jgi:hypothetical protein
MARNEDNQLDYSVVGKEHPDHEVSVVSDAVDPYCNSIPDEHKGTTGWFDVRNAAFDHGVDLSRGKHFQTEPRAWDKKEQSTSHYATHCAPLQKFWTTPRHRQLLGASQS